MLSTSVALWEQGEDFPSSTQWGVQDVLPQVWPYYKVNGSAHCIRSFWAHTHLQAYNIQQMWSLPATFVPNSLVISWFQIYLFHDYYCLRVLGSRNHVFIVYIGSQTVHDLAQSHLCPLSFCQLLLKCLSKTKLYGKTEKPTTPK